MVCTKVTKFLWPPGFVESLVIEIPFVVDTFILSSGLLSIQVSADIRHLRCVSLASSLGGCL